MNAEARGADAQSADAHGAEARGERSLGVEVRPFAVGPFRENAYIVRAQGAQRAVLVDPGEEPARLGAAIDSLGVRVEAILITHCHFDHIGAVAAMARRTGAPVYCPQLERGVLEDIAKWMPPGFGEPESYSPEHTLAGGEHLELAGLDIRVRATPGHSPGHLTYAIASHAQAQAQAGAGADGHPRAERPARALLSGDVLFVGSVGRTDLPGGDRATLERSIEGLMREWAPESAVHSGHGGATTLERELQTNPFLEELRAALAAGARSGSGARESSGAGEAAGAS
ncbi:MAG: MBL fold metallo-hydrolase [Solirubrobacterales bacterium]|nr:MBL fold metallo-hydrolase [Solirubrobacterales bacterium]